MIDIWMIDWLMIDIMISDITKTDWYMNDWIIMLKHIWSTITIILGVEHKGEIYYSMYMICYIIMIEW